MSLQPLYTAAMEPMLPRDNLASLNELSCEILLRAGSLSASLPETSKRQIASLIIGMNSYYSNLIEGHRTYPGEIDVVREANYSADPRKAALQKLGVAHEQVELLMRDALQAEPSLEICSGDFMCWLHKELYDRLPAEFQIVKDSEGKEYPVTPGEFRDHPAYVGHHIPPRSDMLPAFIQRYAQAYTLDSTAPNERLIAAMAAHHRFMWIHPFADGNGRVARLLTAGYLIRAGIDDEGLWSWSRGLARSHRRYYDSLEDADQPRRGNLDGRGKLSEASLQHFIKFGLEVVLDQMEFMSDRLDLIRLEQRIEDYIRREHPLGSVRSPEVYARVLIEVLRKGDLPRGMVGQVIGKSTRTASNVIHALESVGYVVSDGPKSPLRIAFPPDLRDACFPRLFIP